MQSCSICAHYFKCKDRILISKFLRERAEKKESCFYQGGIDIILTQMNKVISSICPLFTTETQK